jgi:N,N'-diacetyllegionaminate synthase
MSTPVIAGRLIGPNHAPFIVLEAGINHNGELDKAREMIRVAKAAGADAVKFQTFKAEEFILDPELEFTYRSQGREVTESMLAMFKRYEFSPTQWRTLKRTSDDEGIVFLSTPQNASDLDLLLEIGVPAIKVGSDDFNNLPLLQTFARSGLPLILSCGMADIDEVRSSLETIGALDGYPAILLVCTSLYPTPTDDVNLLRLKTLSAAFPGLPLGFSDHTQGPLAATAAAALGALVFEKHFTLDHNLPGPDHWFSEDIAGATAWVEAIRTSYRMLGGGAVQPAEEELKMRVLARRSLTALTDIAAGALLTAANIGLRRPGDGLPPSTYPEALGRTTTRALKKGQQLATGDFT